jgi:hypothetical protein
MRREKRAGGRVGGNRDGGEDAGAVVALGPGCRRSPATSLFRNAEKASCVGGVGGVPHVPSTKHWGMGRDAVGPAEASPADGGNRAGTTEDAAEQEGESTERTAVSEIGYWNWIVGGVSREVGGAAWWGGR